MTDSSDSGYSSRGLANGPLPDASAPFAKRLRMRYNDWRLGFTLDPRLIGRILVTALLLIILASLQTTLFSRFRLFGAVPDLMLPFVVTVAMLMKEKWGAITALIAGFTIDSLSGSPITLLPLLYVAVAYTIGILRSRRHKDSLPVALMYTAVSSLLRFVVTMIIAVITISGIGVSRALLDVALPELFANLIFAFFVQVVTRLCFLPFKERKATRTLK